MQVVFYNVPDSRITNFEKMSFEDAVIISQEVEMSNREDKNTFASEFQIIGDDNKVYYKGVFNFGSYDYPNIYHQIKDKVARIKVNKENQEDKLYLLDLIEVLTPDEYKEVEEVDKTLINLDKSRISKLNKIQRKIIYSLGAASLIGFIVTSFLLNSKQESYEIALNEGTEQLSEVEQLAQTYETALLGKDAKMVAFLENVEGLTDQQKKLLIYHYFKMNEFDKAVKLVEGDTVHAETLLLTSNFEEKEKVEKIKAFNEIYPTNEARYDLAYFDKEYKLMLNIPTVNMTVERSEMRTYALLKIGDIDAAKLELNNNSNEQLEKKIVKYEVLTAEIKTLQDRYDLLADENKNKEAKEIKAQIDSKKEEIAAL
jgi:hypothetical protein